VVPGDAARGVGRKVAKASLVASVRRRAAPLVVSATERDGQLGLAEKEHSLAVSSVRLHTLAVQTHHAEVDAGT
jgi:hypothetical protein